MRLVDIEQAFRQVQNDLAVKRETTLRKRVDKVEQHSHPQMVDVAGFFIEGKFFLLASTETSVMFRRTFSAAGS